MVNSLEARDRRVGDVPIRNSDGVFVASLRRLSLLLQGRILPPGRASRRRLRCFGLGRVSSHDRSWSRSRHTSVGGTHVAARASRRSSSSWSASRVQEAETTKRCVKNIASPVFLITTWAWLAAAAAKKSRQLRRRRRRRRRRWRQLVGCNSTCKRRQLASKTHLIHISLTFYCIQTMVQNCNIAMLRTRSMRSTTICSTSKNETSTATATGSFGQSVVGCNSNLSYSTDV